MRFLGYEEKIVRLLESLYQDTMSAVRVDGELAEWFVTAVGVLQGASTSVPSVIQHHVIRCNNNNNDNNKFSLW